MNEVKRRRVLGVLLAVVASQLIGPPRAAPTTCQNICPGSGDCYITSLKTVTPGSLLDCSGRNIFIQGSTSRIEVTNGSFTLLARDLSIAGQRFIEAKRTSGTAPFGFKIELSGKLDATGYLKANSNTGGGIITVKAAGDILIKHGTNEQLGILARGETADDPGGVVTLDSGGNVEVSDPVQADNMGGPARVPEAASRFRPRVPPRSAGT